MHQFPAPIKRTLHRLVAYKYVAHGVQMAPFSGPRTGFLYPIKSKKIIANNFS